MTTRIQTPTAARIEQLKRAAKKLARASAIKHSAALDRLAAENGFKNRSLLAKSVSDFAPDILQPLVSIPISAAPIPAPSCRRYLDGDQDETDLSKCYCVYCDYFFEADHFFSKHEASVILARCLYALERWERRPVAETGLGAHVAGTPYCCVLGMTNTPSRSEGCLRTHSL